MTAPAVPVYALTDARTGLAHLVTLDAVVAGRPRGLYDAVCGARVLAASLTELHSGQCPACYRGAW